MDTLNMMWGADNDGDPVLGEYTDDIVYDPVNWADGWIKSAPDVHGILYLDYPKGAQDKPVQLSYNWWSGFITPEFDFGPRHRDGYRDFQTGATGEPLGDRNRYHVMSNGEIDYDMLYAASINITDPVWLIPPAALAEMASVRGLPAPPNLLSIGPWDIEPGAVIKLPFAFVCGEDLHTDPTNIDNLPYNLEQFYANLDFSDLLGNVRWARWIYDNPGVDSDGDKYAGEFVVCDNDTVYYTGDGIPDWRGAVPPPAPEFWLTPTVNGLRVRFNGSISETEKDVFTGDVEFEGYRIYCGLDDRPTSLALVASYDKLDFDKYVGVASPESEEMAYEILDPPFTLDSLRCLYGIGDDPCDNESFNPSVYTSRSPYVHPDFPDSIFYFQPHDYNVSDFGVTTPIIKVYPDEPDPTDWPTDSIPISAYTDEGLFKYYEYEFVIEGLLPTIPYSINITSFDFGRPDLGIQGMESSLGQHVKSAYPLGQSDVEPGTQSKVYVYPNPYRGDADYRDLGLEGRADDFRPDSRVRAIHFANLPPKCTISIFSLDGDLVREIVHDFDLSDPNSTHDTWDMITRNTQMVVTGLYYWVVEAEDGSTQMGKLAVIM